MQLDAAELAELQANTEASDRQAAASGTDALSCAAAQVRTGPVGGGRRKRDLADVVANLDKVEKINTVQKSGMDWENFKAENGLNDKLQQATKDGYASMVPLLLSHLYLPAVAGGWMDGGGTPAAHNACPHRCRHVPHS